MFCSGYWGIPAKWQLKPSSLQVTDRQCKKPTQSQLRCPLLLSEVVPLVHPTSPRHPTCSELLVVLDHPVVVLHEDVAPLGELGPGVVLPALLLRPVQEDILAGQAGRNQGARQQIEPEEHGQKLWYGKVEKLIGWSVQLSVGQAFYLIALFVKYVCKVFLVLSPSLSQRVTTPKFTVCGEMYFQLKDMYYINVKFVRMCF